MEIHYFLFFTLSNRLQTIIEAINLFKTIGRFIFHLNWIGKDLFFIKTFISQFVGDNADFVLGCFWSDRSGQLWADRDQGVHQVLGSHHVRQLLYHQHHRPSQSPDRHDEPLLSTDLRKFCKCRSLLIFLSFFILYFICLFDLPSLFRYKALHFPNIIIDKLKH